MGRTPMPELARRARRADMMDRVLEALAVSGPLTRTALERALGLPSGDVLRPALAALEGDGRVAPRRGPYSYAFTNRYGTRTTVRTEAVLYHLVLVPFPEEPS